MPVQQIPLRSDQTWAVTLNGLTHIHQLMGQLPDGTWQTVKWVAGRPHPQRGDVLVLPSGVNSLIGAGGSDTLSESMFETSEANPRLLTLSAETYCKKGYHTCTVIDVRKRQPWLHPNRDDSAERAREFTIF